MPNPDPETPVRRRLRDATQAAHARVDACMAGGCNDDAAYRAYLRGMHAFVASVLPAVDAQARAFGWGLPGWLDLLERDLARLDGAELAPETQAPSSDRARALGCLYVIEGSSLGARVLLRQVQRLGYDARSGAGFLHAHADGESGGRWQRFLALLESAGADPAMAAPACHAAVETFGLAERCFRRAQEATT